MPFFSILTSMALSSCMCVHRLDRSLFPGKCLHAKEWLNDRCNETICPRKTNQAAQNEKQAPNQSQPKRSKLCIKYANLLRKSPNHLFFLNLILVDLIALDMPFRLIVIFKITIVI